MWTRMPVSRPRTGLARGSWLRTCPLSTAAGDVDGLPGGNSVAWMCWSTMPAGGPAGLLPPRTPHTRCASGSQPGGVMLVHPARSRSDGTRGAIVNMALTPVSASARTARQTSWWPKVGVIRLAGCFASSRPAAHGCRKPDRSASRRSGVSRVVRGSLASAMWRVVHRDVLAQSQRRIGSRRCGSAVDRRGLQIAQSRPPVVSHSPAGRPRPRHQKGVHVVEMPGLLLGCRLHRA